MPNIYDVVDRSAKLALAYGKHNIHSQNGKIIRHRIESVGSSSQVTVQMALALAPLHSIVKATYDEYDLALENCILHNAGDTPTDAYFPVDEDHPNASWVNYRLEGGFAVDNVPDKAIFQVECREIADYNSSGVQTDFGYSLSPARAAVDAVKLLTGSTSLVEMGSFDEYKSWCAETISVVIDGETVSIPRFQIGLFFQPPFSLKTVLDKICQSTCTDWQWRKGKIRFIPGVDRSSDFDFDLSKVALNFNFQALTKSERPNGVLVNWRDYNDPLLREGEAVIVKRDALIEADDGIENFLEVNAGVCNQSQAERLAHYLAKVRCDLTDFANISGSFKSYPIIPADIVTLTHTTPDWENKRCKVIKKVEDEDAGIGYPFRLQLEPANPYSDTDHTPMVTREAITGANPYAAPPVISALSLSESVRILADGTVNISIVGIATFGEYGLPQKGKVYWKKVGGSYEELRDIFPDGDNQGQFRITNLTPGDYKVKIVTFNLLGVQRTSGVVEYSITCDGKDDAPNPVTSFTLQYLNGYYIGKFTKPNEADIKQFNVYDNSNTFLFATNSTYFTYQSDKSSLTLKVDVEDTSGGKSTKVSASGSISYAVIDKGGVSTLDKVRLKIAGTPIGATHRKIEYSTNSDMSSPFTPIVRDLSDQTLLTIDEITRTYSPTPQTIYVEVKHSLDGGTTWTAASNRLTIQFYNELEFGVPEFNSIGELKVINGSWFIDIPEPNKNGFGAKIELILIDDNGFGILDGDHSASATTLNLQSWFRDLTLTFPESGRIVIQKHSGYFEVAAYTSRDANHIYGLTRGLDGTQALDFENGNGVWLVVYQDDPKGKTFPQLPVSVYAYFHALNSYRDNGSNGWSNITYMGRLVGAMEQAADTIPDDSLTPPPPVITLPDELPNDQRNDKFSILNKYNLDIYF